MTGDATGTAEEREAGASRLPFNFGGIPLRGKTLAEIFELDGGKTLYEISRWKKLKEFWPNVVTPIERYLALPRIAQIIEIAKQDWPKKKHRRGLRTSPEQKQLWGE